MVIPHSIDVTTSMKIHWENPCFHWVGSPYKINRHMRHYVTGLIKILIFFIATFESLFIFSRKNVMTAAKSLMSIQDPWAIQIFSSDSFLQLNCHSIMIIVKNIGFKNVTDHGVLSMIETYIFFFVLTAVDFNSNT